MDVREREEGIYSDPMLREHRRLNWSAIWAGVVATLALEVLLLYFGGALGLSLFDPSHLSRSDSHPFTFATAAWLVITMLGSSFFGAWIAGHWANLIEAEDAYAHGALTWALSMVLVAVGALSAVGMSLQAAVVANQPRANRAGEVGNAAVSTTYSSLDDPRFAEFVASRARDFSQKAGHGPIEVSANNKIDEKRAEPKSVAKNDELITYVMTSANLSQDEAKNFLTSEQEPIAKAEAESKQHWEQAHSRDLALAEGARRTAASMAWAMTILAFLSLCAAVGGSYLGWRQRYALEDVGGKPMGGHFGSSGPVERGPSTERTL